MNARKTVLTDENGEDGICLVDASQATGSGDPSNYPLKTHLAHKHWMNDANANPILKLNKHYAPVNNNDNTQSMDASPDFNKPRPSVMFQLNDHFISDRVDSRLKLKEAETVPEPDRSEFIGSTPLQPGSNPTCFQPSMDSTVIVAGHPKTLLHTLSGNRRYSPLDSIDSVSYYEVVKASEDSESSDERGTREKWDSKLQFILACIAYAIGLGNFWRFPYLCQKNGGGAFLIPYFVMLLLCGIPLYVMELAVGQRLRHGPLHIWGDINSWLSGIGIASCVVASINCIYYNTVVTWCLAYCSKSLGYPLEWSYCPPNSTRECTEADSTNYFWYRTTLNISADIETGVELNSKLSLLTVLAWFLVFVCMVKGLKGMGKLSYFTATIPFLILTVFLFRGLTLPGAMDGVRFLLKPDFTKLTSPTVWLEATTQIFFSLSLGLGGIIAFSSYMPMKNNCYHDGVVVAIVNSFCSLYSSVIVFSIIGFKATTNMQMCVERLAAEGNQSSECSMDTYLSESVQGTGLVFIAFTEAIKHMGSISPLFATLFFLMLLTMGLGSMVGILQGVLTSLYDTQVLQEIKHEIIAGSLCLLFMSCGQFFALTNGVYLVEVVDQYLVDFPLLIIVLCEVLSVSYVYGLERLSSDVLLMCDQRPSLYFLLCWKYICPLLCAGTLVLTCASIPWSNITYQVYDKSIAGTVSKPLPPWAELLVGTLCAVSLSPLLLIPILKFLGVTCDMDEEFNEVRILREKDVAAILEKQGCMPEAKFNWLERKMFCISQ